MNFIHIPKFLNISGVFVDSSLTFSSDCARLVLSSNLCNDSHTNPTVPYDNDIFSVFSRCSKLSMRNVDRIQGFKSLKFSTHEGICTVKIVLQSIHTLTVIYILHKTLATHIAATIVPNFIFKPGCHGVFASTADSGAAPSASLSNHLLVGAVGVSGGTPSGFPSSTLVKGILSSALACVTGAGMAAAPCPSLHTHAVKSPVARATQCDTKMNKNDVKTKFTGRHFVPGKTSNTPFVSPANQKWYWITNVSREHFPMKANPRDDADRRITLALRSTANASTGRNETYGCHVLYVNLDSCISSNAKNHSITIAEAPIDTFTARGHCGWSVRRFSRILITAMAASMPA